MIRELIAARLAAEFADAEGALREIVQTGEQRSQARGEQARGGRRGDTVGTRADRAPTSEAVQRALQGLQREAGLPVTGRFDDATVTLLVQKGLVPAPTTAPTTTTTATAPPTTAPATTAPATTSSVPAPTPAPERRPVDTALQAMKRASFTQQGRDLRARLDAQAPPSARGSSAPEPAPSTPIDRALDPARLLASLVAAGFRGDTPTAAVSSFQTAQGLPPSGQLDTHTVDALAKAGVVSAEAAAAHAEKSSSSTTTSSAKSDSSAACASAAAGGDGAKGSGASSSAQAVRAPAASPDEARERARLESLLAQVAANERGVQENTGDPAALAGHGVVAGQSVGVSGSGGAQGGGADTGGDEASAAIDDGPAGEEDSVGNAHAGDDDHDDHDRGEASDAAGADDVDNDVIPDGHYRTPSLHEQVQAALDTITRLDDDDGPVCYTWDVTLYRPGVYSDGQPAEAIWHLVVDKAHAFDPVWERATLAIAARLLYIEPDAEAPTLDDVLGALKRARVR